jgi:hypothetical protein
MRRLSMGNPAAGFSNEINPSGYHPGAQGLVRSAPVRAAAIGSDKDIIFAIQSEIIFRDNLTAGTNQVRNADTHISNIGTNGRPGDYLEQLVFSASRPQLRLGSFPAGSPGANRCKLPETHTTGGV